MISSVVYANLTSNQALPCLTKLRYSSWKSHGTNENAINEYPFEKLFNDNRSHVIQNVIPKGSTELFWNAMFPKALPSKLVIGLVSQKAANGVSTF
jgi:hypothetical protein